MELTSDICKSIANIITDQDLFLAILLTLFMFILGYMSILGAKLAVVHKGKLFETVFYPFFDGELLYSVYYNPHEKKIFIYERNPEAWILLMDNWDYSSYLIPYGCRGKVGLKNERLIIICDDKKKETI